MSTSMDSDGDGPSPQIESSVAARIRDVFSAADYTEQRLVDRLGLGGPHSKPLYGTLFRNELPRHLSKLEGDDRLNTLIRVFQLGVPVEHKAFARAVAPTDPGLWEGSGLTRLEGGQVYAQVQVVPFDDFLLAIDSMWGRSPGEEKGVMSVSASTRLLARFAIHPGANRALDLGTGCGVLGLLAARHCQEVVGVDLNPRAIRRAAFNARLNGIERSRWEVGDLFGPVEGERFGFVVANPPFVISPEMNRIYRDSTRPLDGICEEIVRRLPEFLVPGGFAQVLCNWVDVRGQDWRDRLRDWSSGHCDAWIMRTDAYDPADYAINWINQPSTQPPDELNRRFDHWMRYYEEANVESIGSGLITLRYSPGSTSHWFLAEDVPEVAVSIGPAMLARFARRDFLESSRDPSAFLESRLQSAPDLAWLQELRPGDRGWGVASSRLRLTNGLCYTIEAHPSLVALISECRGNRPLSSLFDEIGPRLGQDPARLASANIDAIRGLVDLGFLLPA